MVELWYMGKKVAKEGFRLDSGLDFFFMRKTFYWPELSD